VNKTEEMVLKIKYPDVPHYFLREYGFLTSVFPNSRHDIRVEGKSLSLHVCLENMCIEVTIKRNNLYTNYITHDYRNESHRTIEFYHFKEHLLGIVCQQNQ